MGLSSGTAPASSSTRWAARICSGNRPRRCSVSEIEHDRPMATSAEVLQELMHVYVPVGRMGTLDAALRLASDLTTIWPIEASDVLAALHLALATAGPGRARPAAPRALPAFRGRRAAFLRPSARGSASAGSR